MRNAVTARQRMDPGKSRLDQRFLEQILPVVTPIAIDPAHPFPFIPNRGVVVILDLERKATGETIRELVLIPASLSRFVAVPGQGPGALSQETSHRARRSCRFGPQPT